MKGSELAKSFYEQVGRPMLEREYPQYLDRLAAGLVGEGSECFGFDDEISQDHDFGARFCIWLPDDVFREIGEQMQRSYEKLGDPAEEFRGFPVIAERAAGGAKRSGVFSVGGYYKNILQGAALPQKEEDWFAFRESRLAAAVNGEVFEDNAGIFSKSRNILKGYYPENVRLKKLAGCLAYMAQTGQVNYARCLSRGEYFAAAICLSEFIRASLSALYLLNRRYMPFYKWAAAGLRDVCVFPEGVSILEKLQERTAGPAGIKAGNKGDESDNTIKLIEEFCEKIVSELQRQNLTASTEVFLTQQALQVHNHIDSRLIQELPLYMPEYTV